MSPIIVDLVDWAANLKPVKHYVIKYIKNKFYKQYYSSQFSRITCSLHCKSFCPISIDSQTQTFNQPFSPISM